MNIQLVDDTDTPTLSNVIDLSGGKKPITKKQTPTPLPKSVTPPTPTSQTSPQKKPYKPGDFFYPNLEYDRYFMQFLTKNQHSFVVCSYKTQFVFSIGVCALKETREPKLSIWMTQLPRVMGADYDKESQTLLIGGLARLFTFSNMGPADTNDPRLTDFNASFTPRQCWYTNDVDMHDVKLGTGGIPYFISALFCCVCTPSTNKSFKVHWKPWWVTKVASEDRCHLNGLSLRDGVPRYVTCCSQTDIHGAWRENRVGGGMVIDIVENKVLCAGLSMPHSPRWHNGKLWVLNSGHGEFGYVDLDSGETEEVELLADGKTQVHKFVKKCFIPGYLRGLDFIEDKYAVICSSQDRHEKTFQGLPLGDTLKKNGITGKCGMWIVDLKTFDVVHQITFETPLVEIYDVVALPGIQRLHIDEVNPGSVARRFAIDNGEKHLTQKLKVFCNIKGERIVSNMKL